MRLKPAMRIDMTEKDGGHPRRFFGDGLEMLLALCAGLAPRPLLRLLSDDIGSIYEVPTENGRDLMLPRDPR